MSKKRGDHPADEVAGEALLSLVPFVGGALGKRAFAAFRAECQRNRSKALAAAVARSGMTREDLQERIETDARLMPLWLRVLWAAGMNGHDETLRAMGAVFGSAAAASNGDDEDTIEEAALALQALADLRTSHFRVLRVLNESVTIYSPDGGANLTQFCADYVSDQSGLRLDLASQCLVNLANAGLVTTTSVWDGIAYPMTDLGRAVVRAVHEVHDA